MNFFEQQERSKQKSVQLISMFILAVTGIILAVYAVIIVIVYHYSYEADVYHYGIEKNAFRWIDPQILLLVCVVTLIIILGGSIVKIISLRRGGAIYRGKSGRTIGQSLLNRSG